MNALLRALMAALGGGGGSSPTGGVAFSSLGLIAGDPFIVSAGAVVDIDIDTPALGAMTLNGTVRYAGPYNLSITGGEINSGGALEIGVEGVPVSGRTLTLTGAYVPLTGVDHAVTNPGFSRSLLVNPGGRLDVHGAVPAVLYTKLNAHGAAAATTLTLATAPSWASGDEVIVDCTDFPEWGGPDVRVLAGATSGTAATLTAGLSASRWGLLQYPIDTPVSGSGMSLSQGMFTPPHANVPTVLDERARIVNITRGVTITCPNDTDWSVKGHGATVMMMASGATLPIIRMEGFTVRRGGQRGALGRYPIHAHMLSYTELTGAFTVDASACYVKKGVVRESENRSFTIHGTCGMTWEDNVAYDVKGHSYFMEDGSERRNQIRRNMAFYTRDPGASEGALGGTLVSASGDATTCTVNWTSHGLYSGQTITVGGSTGANFTKARVPVTVVTANQFTYLASGSGSTTLSAVTKRNDRLKLHDKATSGFWVTNMDNYNVDNFASYAPGDRGNLMPMEAGTGMWCNMSNRCFGTSALVDINPEEIPILEFSGFEGHSNQGMGLRVAESVGGEGGSFGQGILKYNSGSNPSTDHKLWKNATRGYFNQVRVPTYERWTVADNSEVDFSGATNNGGVAQHHLGVGFSLNNAHPTGTTLEGKYPRSMWATYHGTIKLIDSTAINYPYAAITYGYAHDKGFGGGVMQGGTDFYDVPGVDLTNGLNTGWQLINSHPGPVASPIHLDGRSVDTGGSMRHYSIAGVWQDLDGKYGTAGKFQLPFNHGTTTVDDYLLSGAANLADGPTTGTMVCKTTDTRYYGSGWNDMLSASFGFGSGPNSDTIAAGLSNPANTPITVTRQDPTTGATIGTPWLIKRGDTSWSFGQFRSFPMQKGGRFLIDYTDGAYTVGPPSTYTRLPIANGNAAGDWVLVGLPYANGASAPRVGMGWAQVGSEINAFPDAADVSAGRALICSTSGADIAAVLADTTGNTYFRDTTNNRIWVRYTAGPFAAHSFSGYTFGGAYNVHMIYVKV